METAQAGFVIMLMDRMQTLEHSNQLLSESNKLLAQHVQALQKRSEEHNHMLSCTLHVKLGQDIFSDGTDIVWMLGHTPQTTVYKHGTWHLSALNEAHDQATMFHGPKTVMFKFGHEFAFLCTVVDIGYRTTFGGFWRDVNDYIGTARMGSVGQRLKGQMFQCLNWEYTKPDMIELVCRNR